MRSRHPTLAKVLSKFRRPKMTAKAQVFIDEYRALLDDNISRADAVLNRLDAQNSNMVNVFESVSPFVEGLADYQHDLKRPDLDLYLPIHVMLYILCRVTQPERIVETGIEKGGSAYMMLKGLERNGAGRLWSVDIGCQYGYEGKVVSRIGPLVRSDMEERWNRVLGDAQKVLAKVVEKAAGDAGSIDLFCAGQGHTYEIQRHEVGVAWPQIRDGGVLVLDRPDWCDGRYLSEFLAERGNEVRWHHTYPEGSSEDPFEFTVIVKADDTVHET